MSVLYVASDAVGWLDAPSEWTCFLCGDTLRFPAVCWHGETLLLLHVGCAAHLGPHLIADAREAELAVAPEAHWRRRAVAVVRHRLRAEELVA